MRAPRFTTRSLAFVGIAAIALITQSCSDAGPTAPAPAPISRVETTANLDLGETLSAVNKLVNALVCKQLPAASTTKVIGKAGGTIKVGPHELVIPKDALDHNVTITATSPSDKNARVSFAPHGLEFDKPVTLTMSYEHCNIVAWLLPKRIAYVKGGTLNLLYYLPSLDIFWQQEVSSKLDHFSDYVLAW